ncbi:hypothetical protein E4U54_002872 [Claviceps lovelessii]|nr:hypothetical protein E4U54_002872 [Claviceps lovelessii]
MASFEAMHGDVASCRMHMDGQERMLAARGGLERLGLGGLLRRMIVRIDLNASFLLDLPRYFPGTTFTDEQRKQAPGVVEMLESDPERFIAVQALRRFTSGVSDNGMLPGECWRCARRGLDERRRVDEPAWKPERTNDRAECGTARGATTTAKRLDTPLEVTDDEIPAQTHRPAFAISRRRKQGYRGA